MIKNIIGFSFLCILLSCATMRTENCNIVGTYYKKLDNNVQLIFSKDKFSLLSKNKNEHLANYVCCDTVSHGIWTFDTDRNFIKVSSQESDNFILNLNVVENQLNGEDSITVEIDNPIERHYQKYNYGLNSRDIVYEIYLTDELGEYIGNPSNGINNHFIKLKKIEGTALKKIIIFIYPSYNFSGRNIGIRNVQTQEYTVKSDKSNCFKIYMPNLTYEYLVYLRLNNDYIKILSPSKLEWDGEIYIKK